MLYGADCNKTRQSEHLILSHEPKMALALLLWTNAFLNLIIKFLILGMLQQNQTNDLGRQIDSFFILFLCSMAFLLFNILHKCWKVESNVTSSCPIFFGNQLFCDFSILVLRQADLKNQISE